MRRNSWSAFFCKRKKAKTSGGAWPASGGDTADGGSEMGSRERKKAATSSSMNHEKPTEFDASTSSSAVLFS